MDLQTEKNPSAAFVGLTKSTTKIKEAQSFQSTGQAFDYKDKMFVGLEQSIHLDISADIKSICP